MLIIIALIELAVVITGLWLIFNKKVSAASESLEIIKDEIAERRRLKSEIEDRVQKMVGLEVLAFAISQFRKVETEFDTEKTRVFLAKTEVDHAETRLRELSEMERELQSSQSDLEEELTALKDKESQLKDKNIRLKSEISDSMKHVEELIWEIELSAQVVEQVKNVKTHLLATEDKIEKLLIQIEEANRQYGNLKLRYDALDIEYAQLYEKVSSLENEGKVKANS
jgi:chromosome segregation ATPase